MSIGILLFVGFAAAIIDVVPMIRAKVHYYACASAFVFHVIMPTVLWQTSLPVAWWLKGGILYGVCTLPLAILAAREDRKVPFIMVASSLIIGTGVGVLFWSVA